MGELTARPYAFFDETGFIAKWRVGDEGELDDR